MSPLENPSVFRAVLEDLQTGVYLVDMDRRIVFWNRGAEQISGFFGYEVIGRSCRDEILVHCDSDNVALCNNACPLLETMRNGQPREVEIYLRHKLGQRIPVRVRAIPLKDTQGNIIGAAESFEEPRTGSGYDRRSKAELAHNLDNATGLPGSSSSALSLQLYLSGFVQHYVTFSVLRIHADHLSGFIAKHGAIAAEQLLGVLARTLRSGLRPADFLGCWADQEFLAILPIHRTRALIRTAERLRAVASRSAITWWGDHLSLTLSIGATTVQPGDSVDDLLARADKALDECIDRGGNRFVLLKREDAPSQKAPECS
jgi:diguanylate cyclase (GGDEF)-like protein/PAS domain S-box-containing protein